MWAHASVGVILIRLVCTDGVGAESNDTQKDISADANAGTDAKQTSKGLALQKFCLQRQGHFEKHGTGKQTTKQTHSYAVQCKSKTLSWVFSCNVVVCLEVLRVFRNTGTQPSVSAVMNL